MNEIATKENMKIEDMIYEIRGKQVILDNDLTKLYKCKNGTQSINLAVQRHINKLLNTFILKSQIVASSYYA